jgi:hypothetical protein
MSFHEYDSFPDDSDTPPSPPKLKKTGFNDYGNVLSAMKMYEIDIPSYQQFKRIKHKGVKEEIYNKLLIYWNHGHDNIAGKSKKRNKSKKVRTKKSKRTRSR